MGADIEQVVERLKSRALEDEIEAVDLHIRVGEDHSEISIYVMGTAPLGYEGKNRLRMLKTYTYELITVYDSDGVSVIRTSLKYFQRF